MNNFKIKHMLIRFTGDTNRGLINSSVNYGSTLEEGDLIKKGDVIYDVILKVHKPLVTEEPANSHLEVGFKTAQQDLILNNQSGNINNINDVSYKPLVSKELILIPEEIVVTPKGGTITSGVIELILLVI